MNKEFIIAYTCFSLESKVNHFKNLPVVAFDKKEVYVKWMQFEGNLRENGFSSPCLLNIIEL